jgi:hypothetical protein
MEYLYNYFCKNALSTNEHGHKRDKMDNTHESNIPHVMYLHEWKQVFDFVNETIHSESTQLIR